MKSLIKICLIISFLLIPLLVNAQKANTNTGNINAKTWVEKISDSFIMRHPADQINDTTYAGKWTYDQGVLLEGLRQAYKLTGNKKYYNYIKTNIDQFVQNDGIIKTYKYTDFNLDMVNTGKSLLYLYSITKEKKYKTAADTLRKQIANQPRTKSGGFWHKKIYPYQMWLDGLYMAEPFYAQYSKMFNNSKDFDDITFQFIHVGQVTRDEKTGLYYHGWDESRQQKWADPATGKSPSLWSRSMGWYAMALVDILDFIPKNNPKRAEILKIFKEFAEALLNVQDKKTGMWYQVIDLPDRKGNYPEASASCMFTYIFAKGANKGYLDKKYLAAAKKAFEGIVKNSVTIEKNGAVLLHNICKGAGLGGNPYRDGTFEYYVGEAQKTDDMKGVGPFIMAAVELTKAKAIK